MAKQSNKTAVANLTPQQIKTVWKSLTKEQWDQILNEARPDHRWVVSGDSIKGTCIYHNDTNPSFFVFPEKGKARCFGCNREVWNPIEFYAHVTKTSYAEALRQLKNRFGVKLPLEYIRNAQAIHDHQQMKFALMTAANLELSEVLQNPDRPEFEYAKVSGIADWLRKRDFPGAADISKLAEGQEDTGSIQYWPVGILMPKERLFDRIGSQDKYSQYQNAAFEYLSKVYTHPHLLGSMMFFYHTSPTTIGRIRLRIPGKGKDFFAIDDNIDSEFGLFGLNGLAQYLNVKEVEERRVLVVEGEMDALALIAHQQAEARDDILPIATGGKMQFDVSGLAAFGVKEVSVCPDNDAAGQGWGQQIISASNNARSVFAWDEQDMLGRVKDVDEAIRAYGFQKFYERLLDGLSYPRNHEWLFALLNAELANVDESDIRKRLSVIGQFGARLRDEGERKMYIDAVNSAFGIDEALITTNMVPDEDTPEALTARLALKLGEIYKPMYSKSSASGASSTFVCWNRKKKAISIIPTHSAQACRSALEMDLDVLSKFVKSEIGEPEFLNFKKDLKGNNVPINPLQKDKLTELYFRNAFVSTVQNTASEGQLNELAAGFHYLHDQEFSLVINGSQFYAGEIVGDTIDYKQLDCPIYKNILCKPDIQSWTKFLRSTKDLEPDPTYNLEKTYKAVLDIIRTGWRFKYTELDAPFLAANMMYAPIAEAFGQMVLVAIKGTSSSGKSSLLNLMGGPKFQDLRLCDATMLMEGYTEAGVRQRMNGSSLWLLLDEFEDKDTGAGGRIDRKMAQTRGVLDLVKSLSSGGVISRGSTEGVSKSYHIYFPMMVCGIHPLFQNADINRFITVETNSIAGFTNPADAIRRKYSADAIQLLRRHVTLGLMPHIPLIRKVYREVCNEYIDNSKLTPGMQSRLKENLLPAATLMKLSGEDYKTWIYEFGKQKLDKLDELGAFTPEAVNLWTQMLNAPIPMPTKESGDRNNASIATLIANRLGGMLDDLELGVYYIADKNWLLAYWHRVANGLFKYVHTYRGTQYVGSMKQFADNDNRVVPQGTLESINFIDEARKRLGYNVEYKDISVFNLNTCIVNIDSIDRAEDKAAEERKKMMADMSVPIVSSGAESTGGKLEGL